MLNLQKAKKFWLNSTPGLLLMGLIIGALVSIPLMPQPDIAVISISGAILEQATADEILTELRSSRDNASIEAVVLIIDSPGGSASAIEPIYLEVLELRRHKPVVSYIGQSGASGGYYIAAASDAIYAGPSSTIGSIGVISVLPSPEELDEDVLTTGPFKATGGSRRKAISEVATLRNQFLEAVVLRRGEKLKISEYELARAEVFSGTESLQYGLIDDIGTADIAIQKAAQLASIRNHGLVECQIFCPPHLELETIESLRTTVPTYYYLYFELE